MSNDNPLARAGRESAGDKYTRHRAAAKRLLEQPKTQSRPTVSLVIDGDNPSELSSVTRVVLRPTDTTHDNEYWALPLVSVGIRVDDTQYEDVIALGSRPNTRWSKAFISLVTLLGLIFLVAIICGVTGIITGNDALAFNGFTGVLIPPMLLMLLFVLGVVTDTEPEDLLPKKAVRQQHFSDEDIDGDEADVVAHAVDALGQIALSDTWQSDWLRAPREQIDLAAEAEQIARAGYRLTKLSRSIGDKPDEEGVRAEQWQRLHDAYEVGLDDLRRRAEESVALRIAVDDVADLIAEADKRRIEAGKLTEGETLAAQILAESPEHARAADRLAELTAATGSVHEVLALEIAADIDAINTAAGALAAGPELT